MKLILEAIKALFRKVECGFSAIRAYVDSKVSAESKKLTNNIRAVENFTEEAFALADEAMGNASSAYALANHVLAATVSGGVATIPSNTVLADGRLYVIIPSANGGIGVAKIKRGTTEYYVYQGILNGAMDTNTSNALTSSAVFHQNIPLLVLYSSTKKAFYAVSKHGVAHVTVGPQRLDNEVPDHFYGHYSVKEARLYKYMRVKSSTEGSTKLFDIQVDDNGTITAVEVTE